MTDHRHPTFVSFLQGGFECSSHRRRDGVRLDLVRATGHDRHVLEDYRECGKVGLKTVRDGLRWHMIERSPGQYDWSSWLPALDAAEEAGVQVIWDLFHYGSPDHVDESADDFPDRFADFVVAALDTLRSVSGSPPLLCPVNEINFMSWAVEVGYFPSAASKKMGVFKRQLAQAAIAAAKAIRGHSPEATILWAEPLVHIAPHSRRRTDSRKAESARQGQFQAYDWLTGLAAPELGGDPSLVDLIGLNFYPHNQWYFDGPTIPMGHHEYRSLGDMLVEVAARYGKPMFLSETGAEGSGKASWLHYVCNEVRSAIEKGVLVEGICWYPITAYPGWDNGRHCDAGLFSAVKPGGGRDVDSNLLDELRAQQARFASAGVSNPAPIQARL